MYTPNELTLEQYDNSSHGISSRECSSMREAISLADEVSAFHPAEVKIIVSYEDNLIVFERAEVRLKHPSLLIGISYSTYNKQYSLYCDSFRMLLNVDNGYDREIRNSLKEPNNIGKLSTKKIGEWIAYYEKYYAALKGFNDANAQREKEFRESLKGLGVKWYKDNKSGHVIKNGIDFSFEIFPTWIRKKLEVYYQVDDSIESFIALSNNKYKTNYEAI